jgi:hypothetical protein
VRRMKLGDPEVQVAIDHFIDEARRSALTRRCHGVLGLAAMSTIMACVCTVGEALVARRATTAAVKRFYDEMVDKESWLLRPASATQHGIKARELLAEIRNSLAHALAMPPMVVLLPNREADKLHEKAFGPEHLTRWRLIVPDFITAAEKTIDKISEENPRLTWNPAGPPTKRRGPVDVYPAGNSRDEVTKMLWNTLGATSAGSAATATFDHIERTDTDENEGTSLTLRANSTS